MKQSLSGAALVGMSSATSDADWRELRAMAFAALDHAYAPYSRFRVGAAVRSRDGRVYSGCNVENASYPASMCAERGAIATAVADGARDFMALVIATDAADPAPPCGLCRQVLAELGPRLEVLSCTSRGGESRWSIASLLPSPFTPHSLDRS
ncbi:MAG TPA: cytidine deaminase [Gemmatimonadaceae bacterium]|nr:cytidine deaminase [Gemmatimonadaceae bacterium]